MIRAALAILAAAMLAATPLFAQAPTSTASYVEGAGGVPLAVTVAGPEDAPAILMIHGIGLGAEAFAPQFQSELAKHYRLVAFDLRGHAMSGKPWGEQNYLDRAIWAEDVARVIAATKIKRPTILAWSYGTLVTADYLRAAGPQAISGLMMVGAMGGIVVLPPPTVPPRPKLLADLNRSRALRPVPTYDAQEQATGLIAPMLVRRPPPGGWLDRAKVMGMQVPPYVQGPLRKHPADNTDLAAGLKNLPIALVYGAHDFGMSDGAAAAFKQALPHAQIHRFAQAGHAPFAEASKEFNAMLGQFVTQNKGKHDAH